jgi:hypothetical protein
MRADPIVDVQIPLYFFAQNQRVWISSRYRCSDFKLR